MDQYEIDPHTMADVWAQSSLDPLEQDFFRHLDWAALNLGEDWGGLTQPFHETLNYAIEHGIYSALVRVGTQEAHQWFELAFVANEPDMTLEALVIRHEDALQEQAGENANQRALVEIAISTARRRLRMFDLLRCSRYGSDQPTEPSNVSPPPAPDKKGGQQ